MQSLEIANINRLHFLRKITEAERLKRIFEIREKYEKQVYSVI